MRERIKRINRTDVTEKVLAAQKDVLIAVLKGVGEARTSEEIYAIMYAGRRLSRELEKLLPKKPGNFGRVQGICFGLGRILTDGSRSTGNWE